MEVNGKPIREMDVQQVKEFIEKEFESGVAEKFEAQKIDGKTLVMLAKTANKEQYEACGLMTVADQLKLTSLVNTTEDDKESCCVITAVKPKKPSKAQLTEISEMNRRIYKTKRKAIRAAVIDQWPGNEIPTFKNNKEAEEQLKNLVEHLADECSFQPLGFGKEGIKQHVLDILNERRRHVRKGHDYSLPDKRTLKRKVTTKTESTSSGSSSALSDQSGDTLPLLNYSSSEDELERHSQTATPSAKRQSCQGSQRDDNDKSATSSPEVMDASSSGESEKETGLTHAAAKIIICVMYNAIKVSDVQRGQLQSSGKALGLKKLNSVKDKASLVCVVAQCLLDQGYVKMVRKTNNPSRDDIVKLKPF